MTLGDPLRYDAPLESYRGQSEALLSAWRNGEPNALEIVRRHYPPVHGATLLHYVAANGVEAHRQRTPPNAVAIARILLAAGADVNALAGMYGGRHATLPMLVSSSHPAAAGVQVALVDTLADAGATLDDAGEGPWRSPLCTALAFGYTDAAAALVRRGARV